MRSADPLPLLHLLLRLGEGMPVTGTDRAGLTARMERIVKEKIVVEDFLTEIEKI